ncbi:hypothetical protein Taro_038632 [Colocasia esculenta]|uniref:Gag protein n=1 Tax=Colocasia esculenta TaxID=4460 RepID=A0A843WDD5_COLES|nr:hypothetical protein [Colocasia esculenta]
MASRGRRTNVQARGEEQRENANAGQQVLVPQEPPMAPPPPLIDYGTFMQGLVQAMQTQAQTQAALQPQVQAQAQAPPTVHLEHSGPSVMQRFSRMAPPSFTGESQLLLAESWLREIEKIFRAIRCVEEDKDRAGVVDIHIAYQGAMSVLEYEARFAELSKYAPHIIADERRKVKKFGMGLRPSLRTRLVAFDHRTVEEAFSVACTRLWEEGTLAREIPAGRQAFVYSLRQKTWRADSNSNVARSNKPVGLYALAKEDAEQAEHVTEGKSNVDETHIKGNGPLVPEPVLWHLGVVLEREWLSRRPVRRLEMPRHLSRCNLCHRTHTVALFLRHLLLRQLRD